MGEEAGWGKRQPEGRGWVGAEAVWGQRLDRVRGSMGAG